ncbi:hypothetical protein [Streptomyces sp. NPDC002276]
MALDTLRYGNFQQLGEAITGWQQITRRLADPKKDAEDNLKAKAGKADWAGLNATVTRELVDKTATEFGDAHTQTDSITKILSDTHGELVDYRTQLNDAIGHCGKKHLPVVDTGDGTFVVTFSTSWATASETRARRTRAPRPTPRTSTSAVPSVPDVRRTPRSPWPSERTDSTRITTPRPLKT